DLLDIDMPDDRAVDGVSLMPLIEGEMKIRPQPLGFHITGKAAWHDGDFKAIRDSKGKAWQLFDLKNDPVERENLAETKPKKLEKMVAAWTEWKASVDASDNGGDY
ncbi:MAG: N-acetylgalactosamine 6-sulfate sulfatase, partial [Verrucomicrobiota bacterium]